jgi:alpha/beta hydrolase fold
VEGTDERAQRSCIGSPILQRQRDGLLPDALADDWFWDIYCSPADRIDPRASPLRGKLAGLRPAVVVTSIRCATRVLRYCLCRSTRCGGCAGRTTKGPPPLPCVLHNV